jgi:hypothetical protein
MCAKRLQWLRPRIFSFLGVLAVALSVTAAASASPTTKHITIVHDVLVGDTKISAGNYQLLIDEGRVTVEQGKRVVAQAPAHWEERDETPVYDSVLYADGYHVVEIRFARHRDVLVIATPSVSSAALR